MNSLVGPKARAGDKVDTLQLRNGDRFVCEIKQYDRGVLVVDLDATGNINVKWEHVVGIASPRFFRVELRSGAFLFGALSPDSSRQRLNVGTSVYSDSAPLDSVIRITEIDVGFWEGLEIKLSFGLNLTKASDIAQSSWTLKADRKSERDYRSLDANSTLTFQKDEETAQRHDVSFTTTWYLGSKWFALGIPGYQKNTELGLDARYALQIGIGRYIAQSTTQFFYWNAGVSVSLERGSQNGDSSGSTVQTEGALGTRYALFRFESPEIDLDAVISYYPTLPHFDRSRVDFDLNLSWEIVKDLTWDLSYYTNYDSRPPSESAAKHDFGIVFGLGIKF